MSTETMEITQHANNSTTQRGNLSEVWTAENYDESNVGATITVNITGEEVVNLIRNELNKALQGNDVIAESAMRINFNIEVVDNQIVGASATYQSEGIAEY